MHEKSNGVTDLEFDPDLEDGEEIDDDDNDADEENNDVEDELFEQYMFGDDE